MLRTLIKQVWKVSAIYLMWTIIHYSASNLYSKLCNPLTLIGFASSPFIITAPHCYAFRWCIKHGADALISMWVVLGTWIVSCLTPIRNSTTTSTSTST